MNEMILDELRFEVEERVRDMVSVADDACYQQHKKTLAGAN